MHHAAFEQPEATNCYLLYLLDTSILMQYQQQQQPIRWCHSIFHFIRTVFFFVVKFAHATDTHKLQNVINSVNCLSLIPAQRDLDFRK